MLIQTCVLRCVKKYIAEVNSLLTIFSVLFKRGTGEFWDNKIKVHQRIILALVGKKTSKNSELEEGETHPTSLLKTIETNSETNL